MMKKAWYKYLIIGSVVFLAIVAIIFVIDKKNRVAVPTENLISVYKVLGENVRIYYRRQKDPVRIKSNRGYALLYGVYLLNDEYFL